MQTFHRNLLVASLSLLAWSCLAISFVYFPHFAFIFPAPLLWAPLLATLAGFTWSNWLLFQSKHSALSIPLRVVVALSITLLWSWAATSFAGKLFFALGGRIS